MLPLPNQKYKYITLSQLLASISLDMRLYDAAGFMGNNTFIKVIHRCNDKLGIKLHKSKQCLIDIKDGKGYLPDDFWKIETIFATYLTEIPTTMPIIPGNIVEYTSDISNIKDGKIINSPKLSYKDSCGNCFWAVKQPDTEKITTITNIVPLKMSNNCLNSATHYCPNRQNSTYGIDLDDNQIFTSFKEGQVFLCYLGTMEDENGEPLIPFHPLLNDYYEYSIKEKLFEDIFLNSEDDVEKKLQYVTQKKKEAYIDAWQFSGTPEYKELERFDEKRVKAFYDKWFDIYNPSRFTVPLNTTLSYRIYQ